tara:strand:- start:557 stop:1102 length:546 start_codon:yes stop_codon:yes gene_type:complete
MDIFNLEGDVPTITAQGVFIPEMKQLWVDDKAEDKSKAKGLYAYIYHMINPRSVYTNMPINERHNMLCVDFLNRPISWSPTKAVQAAMDKYALLIKTTEIRALESAQIMCDNLSAYFISIDFKEVDERGTLVHDARKGVQNIKDMSGMVASLMSLKEQVEKGMQEKGNNNRAGAELNMFDK